ncbi:MAG: DUF4435 domain-containing protein [Bacteriovoracaceae bacterium]
MDKFDYSTEARNVLNQFYNVDRLVYVEGDDDIPFWEIIFETLADFSVSFEAVGGKKELLKLANEIENRKADYLLAMDSDYDTVVGLETNPSIIRTYGYSIENTLICTEAICKSLKTLLRLSSKLAPEDTCKQWLEEVELKVRRLVACDILNHVKGTGLSVIPSSSESLMKSRNSSDLCDKKIESLISNLSNHLSETEISNELKNIEANNLNLLDLIKGHFLFSAALKFLKYQAKKLGKSTSISKDMFYLAMIAVFESIFNQNHRHFTYYRDKIESVPSIT